MRRHNAVTQDTKYLDISAKISGLRIIKSGLGCYNDVGCAASEAGTLATGKICDHKTHGICSNPNFSWHFCDSDSDLPNAL